jgi:hypothetical protein
VPIGLINENTYRDGLRPLFHPGAVIAAVREAIRRLERGRDRNLPRRITHLPGRAWRS